MSSYRGPIVVLAFLCISVSTLAQSESNRDAHAVSILNQSLSAMGGPILATVVDSRLETTVRSFQPDGQKIAEDVGVLKTLGRGAWRIENANARNGAGTITNGDWVASRSEDGELVEYPTIAVAEAGNWRIPWLSIIAEANDPTVDVSYVGLEENGKIHRIRLHRTRRGNAFEEITKPCEVFIDVQSGLPTRLTFFAHPPENLRISFPVQVEYSNYQSSSGILIPTVVKYSIRGHLLLEITVSRFSTNTGIAATEFQLR